MRRSWTLVAWLVAAGCAAPPPPPPPAPAPEPAAPAPSDEVRDAERRHAELLREWQQRGVQVDPRGWRMTQIQVVFANVGAVAHRPDLPWQVHYVEDGSIDALAAGGGYVYVHSGLFGLGAAVSDDDDDALAALLAHAIAHTALGHVPLAAASFSAEQEISADRLGALYMALAGYDPRIAPRVWWRAAANPTARLIAVHPIDVDRAYNAAEAALDFLHHYTPGRLNTRWEAIHAERGPLPHSAEPPAPPAPAATSRFARALGTPPPPAEIVSVEGYKGVRIGMTLEEASAVLGSPLQRAGGERSEQAPWRAQRAEGERSSECHHVFPGSAAGVFAFLVVGGRIARVDVYAGGPQTAEGVGVGSAEAALESAYAGRVERSDRHRTVQIRPGHALVFETVGAVVTQYRAGRLPEVAWDGGCP
jgi:hypothetical protein